MCYKHCALVTVTNNIVSKNNCDGSFVESHKITKKYLSKFSSPKACSPDRFPYWIILKTLSWNIMKMCLAHVRLKTLYSVLSQKISFCSFEDFSTESDRREKEN